MWPSQFTLRLEAGHTLRMPLVKNPHNMDELSNIQKSLTPASKPQLCMGRPGFLNSEGRPVKPAQCLIPPGFLVLKPKLLLRGIRLHVPAANNFTLNPFQPTPWTWALPFHFLELVFGLPFPVLLPAHRYWPKAWGWWRWRSLHLSPGGLCWELTPLACEPPPPPAYPTVQVTGNARKTFAENDCAFGCLIAVCGPR